MTDPDLRRLKGLYRRTWYSNRMMVRDLAGILAALGDRGIEVLILKGAALLPLYYRDDGARPMHDLDLAVTRDEVPSAVEALAGLGWTTWTSRPERYLEVGHALVLDRADHPKVDLHWSAIKECGGPEADRDLRSGSVELCVAGVTARALGPTDQLFHALVHGAVWAASPPIQWVLDAAAILASAGDRIDWGRLGRLAREHELRPTVLRCLRYLRERFGLRIPEKVLDRLGRYRPTPVERLEAWCRTRDPESFLFVGTARSLLVYLRAVSGVAPWRRPFLLPRHLEWKEKPESGWRLARDLPARVLALAARLSRRLMSSWP